MMRRARRGTILLVVLAVVAMVVVLVLASLAVIASRRAAAESRLSTVIARTAAESGLELALADASNSYTWRKAVASGAVFAASDSFPAASFSVVASDAVDGDTASNLDDPVTLTATGLSGQARQMTRLVLEPDTTAVTGLSCALAAGGDITFTSAVFRSLASAASNGDITASASTVSAPVAAAGSISGSTFGGSRSSGAARIVLPTQPWNDYVAVGTPISYAATGGQMRNVLLGPGRNPYGTNNAYGVYVIDAGGGDFLIRDSRVLGTIVVLNARTVEIRTCVTMDPAVAGWPVLIVQGSLYLTPLGSDLSESTLGTNFNPASVPYGGSSDADTADNYASSLNGIVYGSGNLTSDGGTRCTIRGALVIGGRAAVQGEFNLKYCIDPSSAPPGFRAGSGFKIRPASWSRVVQ